MASVALDRERSAEDAGDIGPRIQLTNEERQVIHNNAIDTNKGTVEAILAPYKPRPRPGGRRRTLRRRRSTLRRKRYLKTQKRKKGE